MMTRLFIVLKDLVWPAVISVVLGLTSVVLALAGVGGVATPVAFGLSSVSFALLAQRV